MNTLVPLSNEEILNLCRSNSYYYDLCNSDKFYEERTKYIYPEFMNFKKFSETWKLFYNSVDNFIQFTKLQTTEEEESTKTIKEQNDELLLYLINTNNYIGLRILHEKIPHAKEIRINSDLINQIISKKEYELLQLVVRYPLHKENQILIINTFPLEYIEMFSKYLDYKDLILYYNLDNLAVLQFLISEKLPNKQLTQQKNIFLANKAAEEGKYDTLKFFVECNIRPLPKSFLIALQKGYIEIVSYLMEHFHSYYYNTLKDDLIYPYRDRILETLKFLTSDTTFNIQINTTFINELCFNCSVSDLIWIYERVNLYPTYLGVINAIISENFEVIKWILNLNLINEELEIISINEALNSNVISSLDMLKWYYLNGFVFNSLAADIAAVNFIIENVEFLASIGILPDIIGANELVIRCNEENYKPTIYMLEWLAQFSILPNRDVFLENSLDYKVRIWLERRGIVK